MIDATHDPARRSWVPGADGHTDFPIQNLPLGVFSAPGGKPHGGIAIGDWIFDLVAALEAGLFEGLAREAAEAAAGPDLNKLLAMDAEARRALRRQVSDLLSVDDAARRRAEPIADRLLHRSADCMLHLPATIGDYTDFFAGIQHATNTGRLFRPDNPLLPNYKYVPVAYHGRASSVLPSGTDIRRPSGQRKPPGEAEPTFGPARSLDYEMELGIWIGPGNELGQPIPIGRAREHIVGCCLLNDWSARDIQAWEYQPLGPFLAKSFCTSISPWIITAEALAPFRSAQLQRPPGDPAPLPYLNDTADQASGALDIDCDVFLQTRRMRDTGQERYRVSTVKTTSLYWTIAQMVTHHSSAGCNLRPGDLFGTGTMSGADQGSFGSLLELTRNGREPLRLPSGEERRFLEDGDEVLFHAHCHRSGYVSIGFGECRGRVVTPH